MIDLGLLLLVWMLVVILFPVAVLTLFASISMFIKGKDV
jgi:hypothetical protein